MRERTTWTQDSIAKAASKLKVAEDPRAMNQDHLSQQPSHDKYNIGDSSDFGEDVHPSGGTWKAEYSGGEVKRNEIGMPEMRGDTFNHPEKTASLDKTALLKKSNLCVRIARAMLPKSASESVVEDQALAFMHLSDSDLVATSNRLAGQQDDEDEDEDEGQDKQAKGLPPEFLENIKEKKEESKDKKDDDKGQQSKEASDDEEDEEDEGKSQQQSKEAAALKSATEQMQQMAAQMQQMMAQMQQMQGQQQGQPAQLGQQQSQQLDQQLSGQQDPMVSEDQLLDQMLQDQLGDQIFASEEPEIQLDGLGMDVGEAVFAAGEQETLQGLFSEGSEYQNALQAAQIQGTHVPQQHFSPVAHGARTASTRTVGTIPSQGVSKLGGAGSGTPEANEVNRLSSLWQTAPNVSDIFRS